MDVFIIGVAGGIGRLLAEQLRGRGDTVRGLVRRSLQRDDLAEAGVEAVLGDLTSLSAEDLENVFGATDVVVFATGSNGGARTLTDALDYDGLRKTIEAIRRESNPPRLVAVSVMPEAWRERDLDDDTEHYFTVKKQADVLLAHSDLDWVILRPSMLNDEAAAGRVSLGPAERHDEISRADVAEVLAGILHAPRISRRVLELNQGTTPIDAAIAATVS